jgi:hypothetical protein
MNDFEVGGKALKDDRKLTKYRPNFRLGKKGEDNKFNHEYKNKRRASKKESDMT